MRLAEHLHGHAGWLAAAALVHPAVVLRRIERRAPWAVGLSTGLVTAVAVAGALIYGPYRERLRQGIFRASPSVGFLFERKEHLAFAVLALAWVGALSYAAAAVSADDARPPLRRLAHRAYVIAAGIALVVAGLGTTVATFRTF